MSEPLTSGRSGTAAEEGARAFAWDRILVWFMRIVSAVWLVKGLAGWLVILGVRIPGIPAFADLVYPSKAAIVAFAVIDLVAAIGLWLTSTWGGVIWLLAMMVNVVVSLLRPGEIGTAHVLTGAQVLLLCAYVTLSWLASREA
ncbi:DUF6163 family protein [Alsobacter sp. R-9]